MHEDAKYWLNLAKYDLDTAEAMFKTGRYLYVLFTCQQAVEKTLKGLIVQKTNQFPPRIHDLLKLANLAQVQLSNEQAQFLSKLSFYYLETRYPEQITDLAKSIKKQTAEFFLEKTREQVQWLTETQF